MTIYSEFFPLKMVIFHSYVKLPEGNQETSLTGLWRYLPDF